MPTITLPLPPSVNQLWRAAGATSIEALNTRPGVSRLVGRSNCRALRAFPAPFRSELPLAVQIGADGTSMTSPLRRHALKTSQS